MKALLLIYTLGTLTDYWTTAWAIPRGAVEQNPFAAALITNYGTGSLIYAVLLELVVVTVIVWILLRVGKLLAIWWEDERTGTGLRWIVFGSVWLMTLNQWLVSARLLKQIALGW